MVQKVHNLRVAFNVSCDGQSFVYMHAPCVDTVFDNNTVIRTKNFGSPLYDIVYTAFPGILFRNNLYVGTEQCFRGSPYKIKSRVDAQNNWFWNIDAPDEERWRPQTAGYRRRRISDCEATARSAAKARTSASTIQPTLRARHSRRPDHGTLALFNTPTSIRTPVATLRNRGMRVNERGAKHFRQAAGRSQRR